MCVTGCYNVDVVLHGKCELRLNSMYSYFSNDNLRSDFLSETPMSEISSSYGSFNTLKKTLKFSTGLINENI